jgi:serine/threonine protein kinase/Tfp pilus assembly protein PilF
MEDLQELAEQIFVAVLGLDPSERPAYLQSVCRNSPEVRARVESMLKEDELAGSFLQKPLFAGAPLRDIQTEHADAEHTDSPTTNDFGSQSYTPQFGPGEVLCERFEVIRFIARGGMGEVYEVEDRQLRGVHVALKTILSKYAADPIMHERFEREVLNAREVIHPNLCPIYDIFHWNRPEDRLTFLTMKLLAGETLAARLARTGPLIDPEASLIIRQVGAGLSAAHDAGILHRDIKAANIILDGVGEKVYACVTDFGLARAALSEATLLTVGGIAGTPGYMAPELFYGGAPSKASDVYAFGVVAYQVLTGQLPRQPLNLTPEHSVDSLTRIFPAPWKQLLRRCLEPDPERRCKDIPDALRALADASGGHSGDVDRSSFLTRRKMIALTASGCAAIAAGAWIERDRLTDWLEPLPSKRFVALMAWPEGESQAEVLTILDSIGSRLARSEVYVKDLLIVSARDIPPPGASLTSPSQSESSLGANLVLAASLQQNSSHVHLYLRLLDAWSQRVLRRSTISCPIAEISGLTQQAAEQAALLLQLPRQEIRVSDAEELKKLSPDVFEAYSEAEQLMGEPNHSGLQQAIAKYQSALDLNQHFALGYAKLAKAYIEQYFLTHEQANSDLAKENVAKARHYNPNSAMGLLSQALVLLYTGDAAGALTYFASALRADPGNKEILLFEARALESEGGKYDADAERLYRQIVDKWPNYWPARNNLGVLLTRQARYCEAAPEFAAAGMAAPRVALPMANLGTTYIQLGEREKARTALVESLSRAANEEAYLNLGTIEFEDGRFNDALKLYQQAGQLDPSYHLIERNMADCYAMLGNPQLEKSSYQAAARLMSSSLQANPQNGLGWANLAFYHAKLGDFAAAAADIRNADANGATEVEPRFLIVQAFAVMGKIKEALNLLLWCVDNNLSPDEVNLALDLKELRSDPAYLSHLKNRGLNKPPSPCKPTIQ